MAQVRWYRLVDGRQEGPLPLGAMRDLVLEGRVGPTTWVWADGMPTWRRAHEVPALVPPPSQRPRLPGWASHLPADGAADGPA